MRQRSWLRFGFSVVRALALVGFAGALIAASAQALPDDVYVLDGNELNRLEPGLNYQPYVVADVPASRAVDFLLDEKARFVVIDQGPAGQPAGTRDGKLWRVNQVDEDEEELVPTDGLVLLAEPVAIAIEPDRSLLVLDTNDGSLNTIVRIDPVTYNQSIAAFYLGPVTGTGIATLDGTIYMAVSSTDVNVAPSGVIAFAPGGTSYLTTSLVSIVAVNPGVLNAKTLGGETTKISAGPGYAVSSGGTSVFSDLVFGGCTVTSTGLDGCTDPDFGGVFIAETISAPSPNFLIYEGEEFSLPTSAAARTLDMATSFANSVYVADENSLGSGSVSVVNSPGNGSEIAPSAFGPGISIDVQKPRCSDGLDNDGDGAIDYGSDPECISATDNREDGGGGTCGLVGLELLAVPWLIRRGRRTRTRSA